MRITVISTAALLTPPVAYAGMERVSALIGRGLSERGHEVNMIAKFGSHPEISGRLYEVDSENDIPAAVSMDRLDDWTQVFIDISHDKVLPRSRDDLKILECFQAMSMTGTGRWPVLISYGQWRDKFPDIKEAEVVYQPISLDEMKFYDGLRDEYLLYMGQRIPEKRLEWAIELAIRTDTPLKTFSPGWGDPKYHEMLYKMRDEHPDLISIESDIGGDEKVWTLQHAKALIHPVGGNNWCEAGAIVVLEALACGTPCITSKNGCLGEYLIDGVNGYLCDTVEDMERALNNVKWINSMDCRNSVERFDYPFAAERWERLCQRVSEGERWNVK